MVGLGLCCATDGPTIRPGLIETMLSLRSMASAQAAFSDNIFANACHSCIQHTRCMHVSLSLCV